VINTVNTHHRPKNHLAFKNRAAIVDKTLGSDKITRGFKWLKDRPIVEIVGLDAGTMIIPRTIVDFSQNPVYGVETFFRELLPAIPNPFLPGIIGNARMRAKGYKGLYANSNTLNTMHEAWKKAGGEAFSKDNPDRGIVRGFVKNVYENAKVLVGSQHKKLEGKALERQVDDVTDLILKKGKMSPAEYSEKYKRAGETILRETKGESNVAVEIGKHKLETSAGDLLRDTVGVGEQILIKHPGNKAKGVIDGLNNYIKQTAALAVTSSIALGAAIQPMITYVSKKITGKEGFTGYKDFVNSDKEKIAHYADNKDYGEEKKTEDKKSSGSFIAKKAAATAGIVGLMLGSIGALNPKEIRKSGGVVKFAKNIGKNLELKGPFAHMDIVRFVYGGVLAGRFWAARDENELKVSVVRDYAGFLNWLVLGSVVTKGVAHLMDRKNKSYLNVSGPIKGKNAFETGMNWFRNTSTISFAEREARKLKAGPLNIATLAGLGYAMFALGIGVPKLINKYIINKPQEKKEKGNEENLYSSPINNFTQPVAFRQLTRKTANPYIDFEKRMPAIV